MVIGAQEVGIDSIAVTYGYGSIEEISQSDPTFIVHSVHEIKNRLIASKADS